jgi:putative N-acetylmannosamine-6-phosphate epimerase
MTIEQENTKLKNWLYEISKATKFNAYADSSTPEGYVYIKEADMDILDSLVGGYEKYSTDLERFVELYKSFGITCKVNQLDDY